MALNDHDRLTRGHTERVRAYTLMIGEEMGLREEELDRLHWAGLVHDIGKLEVPPELLNKPGRPSDDEWQIIKRHPEAGIALVEPLRPWLGEWADAASQHHERWDGKGYPFGLTGHETSLSGRIVAVADAYDVMTSVRSYKTAMSPADARAELARCAGTQFDPEVVRAFLNISIGRLRLMMGPLSWIAELPVLGRIPVGGAAGTAASSLAAMTFAIVAGLTGHTPEAPEQVAAPPPRVEVEVIANEPKPTSAPPPDAPVPSTTTTSAPTTTTKTATPPTVPDTEVPPPDPEPPSEAPPTDEPTPPDDQPTTVELQATTAEDGPVDIDLQPARFVRRANQLKDAPAHGHVVVQGSIATYTPVANWSGTDAFSVRDDGTPATITEVTVTVRPVNDAPTGSDANVTVDEDGTATLDLAPRTADVDGDPLTVSALGTPAHGNASGSGLEVTYSPDPDVSGSDMFTYTVRDPSGATASGAVMVTITPVQDPPVGTALNVTTVEDAPIAIDLSDGVSDADGDSLTIDTVGDPANGATSATGPLSVDYVPVADFNGFDQFTVQIEDPGGASATVTVDVTVTPVNDAPSAIDHTVTAPEDQAVSIDLTTLTDDVDGDALLIDSLGTPGQGEVTASELDLTYTPTSDSNGTDTFTFTVSDPAGTTASGTITVHVQPVQDAPVAQDDAFVADPITPLAAPSGALLANDFDVDGENLTIVPGLTAQGLGLVIVSADGSFVYTPPALFTGTDTFAYTVTDGIDNDTAVVTVTVNPDAVANLFYLTPTPSSTAGWTLGAAPPPAADPEPDTGDEDDEPGTEIKHGDHKPDEDDQRKFREWSRTFASPTQLDGPVTLDLWSMVHDGEDKDSHIYVWISDCTGSTCVELLAFDYHAKPWNAEDTWANHTFVLGSVNTTIAAGHDLRLRIQFAHEDTWIAQSGGRPSSLAITTG